MKELEKTKRISVAAVLTILAVIIALLSYKRPQHNYDITIQKSMGTVLNKNHFKTLSEIDSTTSVLIDVRNRIAFDRGHLNNAVHMYAPEILSDENTEILDNQLKNDKELVLYGANPQEAILPYHILNQLGYSNISVLPVSISYKQTEMVLKSVEMENLNANIQAFIDESIKKAAAKPKPKKVPPAPKKVIPKKKKKKMPIEGGC